MDFLWSFSEDYIPLWYRILYGSIVLAVCLYAYFYVRNVKPDSSTKKYASIVFLLFFILFAVGYCINSDYFNYRNWVFYANHWYDGDVSSVIYQRLAYWCNGNYNLFRAVVWGGALVIVYYTSRLLRTNTFLTLLFLFVFFNPLFCYARASLAMAVFWLGVSVFITVGERTVLRKVLGILIIVSSIFIHREMIVPLICFPFVFVSFKKKNTFFFIVLTIIAMILGGILLKNNIEILGDYYLDKVTKYEDQMAYGEMKWQQRNVNGMLRMYAGYLMFYILFFILYRWLSSAKQSAIPDQYVKIYRITVGIVISTIAMVIVSGGVTVFFYRTLYTVQIPFALLCSCICSHKLYGTKAIQYMIIYAFVYHAVGFVSMVN